MILNDTPQKIIEFIKSDYPEIDNVIQSANQYIQTYKGAMQPYQAACLYALAKPYKDKENASILEIGTGLGYSTFFLASALPDKQIVTLNPNQNELKIARNSLKQFEHIVYLAETSRQHFEKGHNYDFIFVDGDHKDIEFDLQWIDRLNKGGTILFHDFSGPLSKSPCIPVWNAIRKYDKFFSGEYFTIIDTINTYGMAGWHKFN